MNVAFVPHSHSDREGGRASRGHRGIVSAVQDRWAVISRERELAREAERGEIKSN